MSAVIWTNSSSASWCSYSTNDDQIEISILNYMMNIEIDQITKAFIKDLRYIEDKIIENFCNKLSTATKLRMRFPVSQKYALSIFINTYTSSTLV